MKANIVCVFLINGLLVTAFPANDGVDNGIHITVPVAGVAEFSGTVPATGSVALATHTPCPEVMLPFTPSTPDCEPLPKNIMLGATLADAILAEAGEELDAKMAEIDAFVGKELEMMGPQMKIANRATTNIESALDSTLQQMESEISTELFKFDEFIDSQLAKTEEMVQTALRNVESYTFVDTELEKVDAIVDSEVAKINFAVESNLAKTESLVESESEKVDAFIEAELAKTDAFVNSELSKIKSVVEMELENVEKVLDVGDSCTMSSDDTSKLPYTDTGFAPPTMGTRNPIIPLNEAPYNNHNLGKTAPVLYHRKQLPMVNIRGTARATGSIKLFSKFPCPPLQATEIGPDGKKYIWIKKNSGDKEKLKRRPKVEFPDFSDFPDARIDANYEDLGSEEPEDLGHLGPIPIRGEAVFEGTAPAYGSVSITGQC
ncbi:uncharacterized protein LOC134752692 isoform X2 [Cydia strobilella]|uniref:uncharacterized protein LOC134752692 isoform X2 n=1 Tax=Cydia strobilella TaxID=1100964 RepID=UPI003004550E